MCGCASVVVQDFPAPSCVAGVLFDSVVAAPLAAADSDAGEEFLDTPAVALDRGTLDVCVFAGTQKATLLATVVQVPISQVSTRRPPAPVLSPSTTPSDGAPVETKPVSGKVGHCDFAKVSGHPRACQLDGKARRCDWLRGLGW